MKRLTDRRTIGYLHEVSKDVNDVLGRVHHLSIGDSSVVVMSLETYDELCRLAGLSPEHQWENVL